MVDGTPPLHRCPPKYNSGGIFGTTFALQPSLESDMDVLYLVLLFLGALCLLGAAFDTRANRVNLLPLGLFLWILVPLLQTLENIAE